MLAENLMNQNISIDEAIKHASILFNQAEFQQAEAICNSILAINPKHPDANHILGVIAFRYKNFKIAIKLFKKAISNNKNNPEYYTNIGNAYKEMGDKPNAIKSFRNALKVNSGFDKAHFNLANIYYEMGNVKDAEKFYKSALKISPGYAEALNNLGSIYMDANDNQQARKMFVEAVSLNPEYVRAINNLGIVYDRLGDFDLSLEQYKRAVSLSPDYADVYYNMGNLYRDSGDFSQAINSYSKSLEINPGLAPAENNLALVYSDMDDFENAIKHFMQAIAVDPGYKYSYLNYGNLYRKAGMYGKAAEIYKKAIEVDRNFVDAYYSLACVSVDSDDSEQAIGYFNKTIELDNNYSQAYKNLGNIYKDFGDTEKAKSYFIKAISIQPDYAEAYRELSTVVKLKEDDAELKVMLNMIKDEALSDVQRMHVAYGLARTYESMKKYDNAFEYLETANVLRRKLFPYDAENIVYLAKKIKEVFTEDFIKSNKGFGVSDQSPVFILGMPRSGSSLVEQILATHSDVYGAGELDHISNLVKRICASRDNINYPECVTQFSHKDISNMAEEYLGLVGKDDTPEKFITDKMPHNFLYVGLIKVLFPNAKIIHTVRDPIDNCLSIYKTGFYDGHAYADNLKDLGDYYNHYREIMAYWNKLLPGDIFEVKYEHVVDDQSGQTRRMLEYLELPWEEACLSFYKTKRRVHTASATQVTRGIYRDSLKLWKCYEKQLQPLISVLKS